MQVQIYYFQEKPITNLKYNIPSYKASEPDNMVENEIPWITDDADPTTEAIDFRYKPKTGFVTDR